MAFKAISIQQDDYNDIESLFRDLNSSIQSLYSHQSDIIRHYQNNAADKPNVAIELPTGSGKTLVGLLIAEFRRRTQGAKALYLCPTRQLVNQVVNLANTQYGIGAISFTGSNKQYSQSDKYKYQNGDAIAVTTYSSLFNARPWFNDPDIIIIDDAHTAENYVASSWSVEINRGTHETVYRAFIDTIKRQLSYSIYRRLTDDHADHADRSQLEKLPNNVLFKLKDTLLDILSNYLNEDEDLKWTWLMIRDHLDACQVFMSWRSILIRPLIPPSLTNSAFKNAKQRVFMSATLGEGGDLQRITGIQQFYSIPIPEGWDKQGMGRRFFMFPDLSLAPAETKKLISELLNRNERSVILVSSDDQVQNFKVDIAEEHPDISFFTARDIEKSKDSFINSNKAAIVMANRFDGIDFAGDQSRLLFLVGIPYASNLQEKFFQSRMNASIIFNDRNKTRLIQAIGRCTRSPKDYSAICVLGEKDLSEWLVLKNKYKFLHPELQAELLFGIENSTGEDSSVQNFIDNYSEFIGQTELWQSVNSSIIKARAARDQEQFDGAEQLANSANLEVEFQYKLWNKQYEECFDVVNQIIKSLEGGKALSGYRAYWNYQAGFIADILYTIKGDEVFSSRRDDYFEKLVKICPSATWSRGVTDKLIEGLELDDALIWNVENLQKYISTKKVTSTKKYGNYIRSIEYAIDNNDLEYVNLHIGFLLGFKATNIESKASPDPIWVSNDNLVIVFEDKFHQNTEAPISIEDIRQALSHTEWVKANIKNLNDNVTIYSVMISNRSKVEQEGKDISKDLLYWNYSSFISFSRKIISIARTFPNYYGGEDDSNWREFFADEFYRQQIGPNQIINLLTPFKEI